MAHAAELDNNNVVLRVIVVPNEVENRLEAWCNAMFGGRWKQTSYNANMRKNYAGIGYTYDAARDAFIPPKPFASWVLIEETCQWAAPTPMPTDGSRYAWDEATTSWVADPVQNP